MVPVKTAIGFFKVLGTLMVISFVTSGSWPVSGQSVYWVGFADKKGSSYSINRPEEFLSSRSLERRARQMIPVDEADLPVSKVYIDSILGSGAVMLHASRWLNGITVRTLSDSVVGRWGKISFVKTIELVKPSTDPSFKRSKISKLEFSESHIDTSFYGQSVHQVSMLNGHYFHQKGIKGAGMLIAVMDAGFYRANEIAGLSHLYETGRILGTRDFVDPSSDIYAEHPHGMSVLSCMAGYVPGQLIGTATDASYLLIRTEDDSTEYRIEEYNWIAGAEYADSMGADIINSSLGYYEFDDPGMNYRYEDMDGLTTRVTRGANMAASRGMLVFSSAGNEARTSWKYIIAPSDGINVISVAAVDKDRNHAPFSSIGPSPGSIVKPDLAAMGRSTAVLGPNGLVQTASGTSFSSPVLAGMAACFWQANRSSPATEISRLMKIAGHLQPKPDIYMGYGIPDMRLADLILNQFNAPLTERKHDWTVFPNPFRDEITFISNYGYQGEVLVMLYSITGTFTGSHTMYASGYVRTNTFYNLPPGVYLLKIAAGNTTETHRIIKTR